MVVCDPRSGIASRLSNRVFKRLRIIILVPMAGLEPARLAPLTPQASVSTSSTTSARQNIKPILRYCCGNFGTSEGPPLGGGG
jgi:hypothetical protein